MSKVCGEVYCGIHGKEKGLTLNVLIRLIPHHGEPQF